MDDNDFALADLEMERVVLGQILAHGVHPMYASVGLTPEAFYRDEHVKIYNAICAIHKRGVTADPVLVRRESPNVNASDLAQMLDGIPRPSVPNAREMTLQLLKIADARSCYYAAIRLHKTIKSKPGDVDAAVAEHLATLDAARRRYAMTADRYTSDQQIDAYRMSLQRDEERVFFHVPTLDEKIGGVRRGEVCGIMARPGIGKTLVLCHIIRHAVALKIPTVMFSLEMPVDQIVSRLARAAFEMGRVDLETAVNEGKFEDDAYRIGHDSLVIIDTAGLSMTAIEQRLRIEREPQLVLIDHMGLVGGERGQSTYDRVSSIARHNKELAKRFRAAVIVAIQVSRETGGDGSRELSLGSARDSGVVEEVMDYLVAIRRPDRAAGLSEVQRMRSENVLMLSLLKNRHGEVGTDIAVEMDSNSLRLSEQVMYEPPDQSLEHVGAVANRRG
jgi:replicative DNA helicase